MPGIHLKGAGRGVNGTCLYRDTETPDYMIKVHGSAVPVSEARIEISGICFQAMKTRLYEGDRGTGYPLFRGIALRASDFYLHDCKFQWFSNRAIEVSHLQSHGKGVISNNEFIDCLALGQDGSYSKGYGISVGVYGDVKGWISVTPETDDFVFIEDNYFARLAPAVAGSQGALFVFRHNTCELFHSVSQGAYLDMHGAYPESINPDFNHSARFAEVYENTFIATPEDDILYFGPPTRAINFRGGE